MGMTSEELRICKKCGELKPVSCFGKWGRGDGALRSRCKVCKAAYQREYLEKVALGLVKLPAPKESRTCRKCGVHKPADCFGKRGVNNPALRSKCRECAGAYRRERYVEDPERYCVAARKWCRDNAAKHAATKAAWVRKNLDKHATYSRKVLYGMTKTEFDVLLASQKGVCAICGGPPVGRRNLSVDHCHETGKIRGLLCGPCNTGIGQLKDDPEIVQKALLYLL